MEKNALVAVISSLALLSAMSPVSASGGTLSECELQQKAAMQAESVEYIIQAAQEILKGEAPDLESPEIRDFFTISDAYDELSLKEQEELPADIKEGILTVRRQIGELICSREGIRPAFESGDEKYEEKNWYVKTEVEEGKDKENILAKIKEKYEGSAPEFIYYKDISYTDIRNGESYMHWDMISLTFPVPQGYDALINPQVLTYMGGKLVNLSPQRQQDSFYVDSAMFLENIIVVDVPVALTGLTLESEASVNKGQKLTLKASPLPAGATEKYSLRWESSDPKVAEVSGDGVVTGTGCGSCVVTAYVAGRNQLQASCQVTVVQGAHALSMDVEQALEQTRAYMLSVDTNPTIGSEWFVVGLARGGMDIEADYFKTYYNHVANYLAEKDGVLTNSAKYTEYSKTILAMTAMGKDAQNIAGYNLFAPLADMENVKSQGVNGPIWALIALNSNPSYTIPQDTSVKEQTTKESLIDYVLQAATPKGGWSMEGQSPDPDVTAMALQAFAPYYQKPGYERVTEAVDASLELLSSMQNSAGGYSSMGSETLESCVQVVTALCMLGIDPEQDERFVKGGYWTVENLFTFRLDGGGFMHVKEGEGNGGAASGEVNGMSTEQAYYALVAYQRLKEGRTGLYDMSDVTVEKGRKGDGQGTGLEPPKPSAAPTPSPAQLPASRAPHPSTNENVNQEVPASAVTEVTNTAVNPTPAVSVARPAVRLASAAPSGSTSANTAGKSTKKTASAKTVSQDSDGWDSGLEEYQEETDDWDFGAEPLPVNEEISSETEEAQEDKEERTGGIPPFAAGVLGGLCGAGGLEGGRLLYKKKKRRK